MCAELPAFASSKQEKMNRLPVNSWSLTEATFNGDPTRSHAGTEELGF
jgi:hypothetical protein